MNITEWTDSDFFAYDSLSESTQSLYNLSQPVRLHKFRQTSFFLKCMQECKKENYTWTSLVDTDEYILPNHNAKDDANVISLKNSSSSPSTVMELIHLGQQTKTNLIRDNPCLPTPRLFIGGKESSTIPTPTIPPPFQATQFVTYRYRYHFGLNDFTHNRLGKALVDVSRVADDQLYFDNIYVHRPIKQYCSVAHMKSLRNAQAPFVVHHYLGSFEQWSYRDDPRKWAHTGKKGSYDKLSKARRVDDHIRPWLEEFVRQVGLELATELLKDVGKLE